VCVVCGCTYRLFYTYFSPPIFFFFFSTSVKVRLFRCGGGDGVCGFPDGGRKPPPLDFLDYFFFPLFMLLG
jgi:hypothetical protein